MELLAGKFLFDQHTVYRW